jgi:uncharacterized phiE125 gp8 family phage protein
MPLLLLTPPAEEPIDLADAKAFARIDAGADDLLVTRLIVSARQHIEAATRRFLVTQGWRLVSPPPTSATLAIPATPVAAVTAVRLRDSAGGVVALGPADWQADLALVPPRLTLLAPAAGRTIEADLTLGYGGAATVPEGLRHAVRLLVATWYEDRGLVGSGSQGGALPGAVLALLSPFRDHSL